MPVHLSATERRALRAAIALAEHAHRGEIRVHIEETCRGHGPLARAQALYQELGLQRTRDGTAVLLYVAERDCTAAVFAGPGVSPESWDEVVAAVTAGYRDGDRIAGIERAIAMIGDVLREVAPGEDEAGNELPNQVTTD